MNTEEHRWKRRAEHAASPSLLLYLWSSVFICGSLSCSGYTGPRSVLNADPAVKIPEIRKAVDAGDRSVMAQLVSDLDSDDAAVRFYAIEALERFTGERLGYDWTAADRFDRRDAIARWQQYLREHPPTSERR